MPWVVNAPGNQTELVGKVRSYLRSRQCKPDIVANYFLGKACLLCSLKS